MLQTSTLEIKVKLQNCSSRAIGIIKFEKKKKKKKKKKKHLFLNFMADTIN